MINDITNEYRPDFVSPPGETLEEMLDDRGMSQVELAERTGRPRKTINEIIQGKAVITPETALQFERVLGAPASFWLSREQLYREFIARQQDEELLATQVGWLDELPVRAMLKAGWIKECSNQVLLLREVLQFFGIASPAQWQIATAVFRRAQAFQGDRVAVAAWLRRGELLAQAIEATPFDETAFQNALHRVRTLTIQPFNAVQEELIRCCAQAGVAVVIVPELAQTRLCGATRWLSPTKALIQLSLRYKTDDQFWFTFFHEAGHILLHGKRAAFVDEEEHAEDEREVEANRFAMDRLIPPRQLAMFNSHAPRYISQESVERFAAQIKVAPGIVVGRLQHDGILPRTHLNKLKQTLEP